ncbi:MAG: flagellar export chaperone FliS [Clostridiales bacterium]|jgi:flagellar protein FliS|nr:flagellar export chaperone FliS [Clostridiales bacterium]
MPPAKTLYEKYEDNNIFTASKEELTLMLYEGGLKFTNQAIVAVENNEVEKAHNLIVRVEDIIREFQMTLDFKYEISNNFNQLYDYMHQRLVEANMKKDAGILTEVRDMFRDFRDTWKEAMSLAKQQPVSLSANL